jgi:hypothetical protein
LPSTVIAKVVEPSGYTWDIDMRAVGAGDRISWVGTFPVDPPRVTLDFTVTVFPEADTAFTMEFSERVFRRPER